MMYATNGATLWIGGVLADKLAPFIESDFTSQTWVQIKGVESLGSLTDTFAEISADFVDGERTKRIKGSRDGGVMDFVVALNPEDAGQIALRTAFESEDNYAFKLVFDDAPPAPGTPSERKFIALVGKAEEAYDTSNAIMKLNVALWVNSNVVRKNRDDGV